MEVRSWPQRDAPRRRAGRPRVRCKDKGPNMKTFERPCQHDNKQFSCKKVTMFDMVKARSQLYQTPNKAVQDHRLCHFMSVGGPKRKRPRTGTPAEKAKPRMMALRTTLWLSQGEYHLANTGWMVLIVGDQCAPPPTGWGEGGSISLCALVQYVLWMLDASLIVSLSFSRNTSGAAVAKRLEYSPPTKANRAQSLTRSLADFRKWESCRTMPLVGGFSRRSPVSPTIAFRYCSVLS
ncbi:hypothetical protein PR048_000941 [Dryococelus australis]|uniref:Uncharacterized protein n=1 Tax=Dryococelus australis TaxID=614101 RepID=A0ABQ9IFZ6_9NEOP|nr:hypothetical protein PR048_000941 [Dryococelus australis]